MTDWGADVIKIEHPVRGDAQRGIQMLQRLAVNPQRSSLMQHPNRGKRSVGIDISTEEGRELLYEIAKTAAVFLTNYLPSARQKLKIDIEHIRAANPEDRKSVVSGKSVSVRVDLGGRRIIKKKEHI